MDDGILIDRLRITSPKRNRRLQTGWEGFFPYYAGYPESFASALLESAELSQGAVVLDPWNGSGTTTHVASRLGLTSLGLDLNPAMVVVARARLLPPSEADSIEPIGVEVLRGASVGQLTLDAEEPLLSWFEPKAARAIRAIERSIHRHLVGSLTMTPTGVRIDRISGMAATLYVALFTACRELTTAFRSSNPTWLRRPKASEARVSAGRWEVARLFKRNLEGMAAALAADADLLSQEQGRTEIRLADTASTTLFSRSVDFILTSPPYCTRIDYTAATRVELAVLGPLLDVTVRDLGRQMIGSTQVPSRAIRPSPKWGPTCLGFLDSLRQHPSKASSGYYLRTHQDYFDKMSRSLGKLSAALGWSGTAVLVVQDSYYKEIHNDLPTIVGEMAEARGLELRRTERFELSRSMSGINPYTRAYNRAPGAVEAVLCFQKAA